MIEAFIYPVPKGEEYEAPRMRDCHGATRLAMTVPPHPTLSPREGEREMRMRAPRARPSVCIGPYGLIGGLQAPAGDAFGLAGLDEGRVVRRDARRHLGGPSRR